MECLECKLQLHDNQVELLKASRVKQLTSRSVSRLALAGPNYMVGAWRSQRVRILWIPALEISGRC